MKEYVIRLPDYFRIGMCHSKKDETLDCPFFKLGCWADKKKSCPFVNATEITKSDKE